MSKGVSEAWCIPFIREVLTRLVGAAGSQSLLAGSPFVNIPTEERGVFDVNSLVRDRDLIDGSSKTFLMGECATGRQWPMCSDLSGIRGVNGQSQSTCGNPLPAPNNPARPAIAAVDYTNTPAFVRLAWIVTGVMPSTLPRENKSFSSATWPGRFGPST